VDEDRDPESHAPAGQPQPADEPAHTARAVTEPAPPAGQPGQHQNPVEADGPPRPARRGPGSLLRELPLMVVLALVLTLLFKTFLAQSFSIPSGSMENTLQVGDHVMVDKLTPWFGATPQRGEVVVFRDRLGWLDAEGVPASNGSGLFGALRSGLTFIGLLPPGGYVVKRVIGVGGDDVRCTHGRLLVDGVAPREPYLDPDSRPCAGSFDVRVPAGRLFVMGDHRSVSADSSHHLADQYHGTIAAGDVVGSVFVVFWRHGLPGLHLI
jgi:signal peptidase I